MSREPQFAPGVPIDILVCYCKERKDHFPHWMLMLISQGAQKGTWYHTDGGPTQNRPYKHEIEPGKRVDSWGIASKELVGTTTPEEVKKITAASKRVPAQQCQRYVTALLHEMERKGLGVKPGEAARINRNVQMSQQAMDYAAQHPVDHPFGPYVPSGGSVAGPSGSSAAGPSGTRRRHSPARAKPARPERVEPLRPQRRPAEPRKKSKKKKKRGLCMLM